MKIHSYWHLHCKRARQQTSMRCVGLFIVWRNEMLSGKQLCINGHCLLLEWKYTLRKTCQNMRAITTWMPSMQTCCCLMLEIYDQNTHHVYLYTSSSEQRSDTYLLPMESMLLSYFWYRRTTCAWFTIIYSPMMLTVCLFSVFHFLFSKWTVYT